MRHSSFSSPRPRSSELPLCLGWDLRMCLFLSLCFSLRLVSQPRCTYLPRTKLSIQTHHSRNRTLHHLLAHALLSKPDYKPHAPRILVLRRDAGRHHVRVPAGQPLLLLAPRPQVLQDCGLIHPPQVHRQGLQRDARLVPDAEQYQRLKGFLEGAPAKREQEAPEGGRRGGDDRLKRHEIHGHGVHCVSVRF